MGQNIIINFLLNRLQVLENNTNHPKRILKHTYPTGDLLKNDLENLYKSKASHIVKFKESLEEIPSKGCPYCNSYHPVSEIDHYLQYLQNKRINTLYFINLPPSYLKNYNMQIILFISK